MKTLLSRLIPATFLILACPGHAAAADRVSIVNRGVTLVGSFYPAPGSGSHPAVILLPGSGKAPRDSATFHALEPFFNSLGLGVLAYDKRGSGESSGTYDDNTPLSVLASDGIAAIEFLKTRKDVDAHRIGVWGISQGGSLGPLMATMSPDVAFVISVSGPGVSIAEQAIHFRRTQMLSDGFSVADADEAQAYRRVVWAYYGTGLGREAAQSATDTYKEKAWFLKLGLSPTLSTPENLDPSLRTFMQEAAAYDPLAIAAAVKVPVLTIFGAKDSIVPPALSLENLIQAYARGGNRLARFALIPNAGHGMNVVTEDFECHECAEKKMQQTGKWETAPGFFETMRDWITRTVPR